MLIEIRVIAEDSREALPDLARLARRFGLDVANVEIARSAGAVIATAAGEMLGRAKLRREGPVARLAA